MSAIEKAAALFRGGRLSSKPIEEVPLPPAMPNFGAKADPIAFSQDRLHEALRRSIPASFIKVKDFKVNPRYGFDVILNCERTQAGKSELEVIYSGLEWDYYSVIGRDKDGKVAGYAILNLVALRSRFRTLGDFVRNACERRGGLCIVNLEWLGDGIVVKRG